MQAITFIIRASGEPTVKILKSQLDKQISKEDKLIVLDAEVSFEEKLKQGYELAVKINNKYSVFIDGDILLRSNVVSHIRKKLERLGESNLGFGLKLWDKFYNQPKFRGVHIYNTRLLVKALEYTFLNKKHWRPESYVKMKMKARGYDWSNNTSQYVAGLHDYYQKPIDIYYKFLIRSHRSKDDLEKLIIYFNSKKLNDIDFRIALKGLKDGIEMDEVKNNKYLYKDCLSYEQNEAAKRISNKAFKIDFVLILKLLQHYKFGIRFWNSI